MRKAKIKEKKPYRLNLRLTEQEMLFLNSVCDVLNMSPSEYIRKTIDSQMYSAKEKRNENK